MMSPAYISWVGHGAASLAAPGIFTDATMNMFGFDASRDAMQATVDTLLNPAAGPIHYDVAVPIAMVSFMDIAKCTSGTDIVGWLPGREAALWIPLIEKHPDPLKDRFVFWAPYIFISYTIGMLTGREIWGWPKVLGTITVPSDNPGSTTFSCASTYFPTLAADTCGVEGPLLQVRQTATSPTGPAIWHKAEDAVTALVGSFLGTLAEEFARALHISPQVPSVALKQFRDPAVESVAAYQAIVDSPIAPTTFNGGGMLLDSFALEITTCESHQIVQDFLGTTPEPGSTTIPITHAAWIGMDFNALNGRNVVVAGQVPG